MFSQAVTDTVTDTDVSRNPSQCVVCGETARYYFTRLFRQKKNGYNTGGPQHKYLETLVKS